MKAYKALIAVGRNGKSVQTFSNERDFMSVNGVEGFRLSYREGFTTVPKIGKLFGFKYLDDAIDYLDSVNFGHVVMEGEVDRCDRVTLLSDISCIKDFWKLKKLKKKILLTREVPNGTVSFNTFLSNKIVYIK